MKRQGFWSAATFFLGLTAHLFLYDFAIAQQQPAGVVTGIQGQAQLTRPAATPSALKFKDGVVIRDVVDTKEKSLARILFGGRSTVTVRELSRLDVREETLPTGTRTTHDLSSGAILVNVARQLMRPGDEVQIRTPNAIAAVRGSVLFGQYIPPSPQAPQGLSFFALLSGSGIITPLGLPPLTLTANTQNNGANVSGSGPGVQANAVNVPPGQVNQILAESQVGKAITGEANKDQVVAEGTKQLVDLFEIIDKATNGGPDTGGGGGDDGKKKPDPDKPVVLSGCTSCIKNGGFETTGSIPEWTETGTTGKIITTFGSGTFSPTEGSNMAIIHTGSGASSNTTSALSQSFKPTKGGSYLITFDYNFMSNEFPTKSTTFNDTFEAVLIDANDKHTSLAKETRNSSTFKTDKGSISGGGFTLSSGNGYVGFKSASKTVVIDTDSAEFEFEIKDVGDTAVDSAVLLDNVKVELDPPLYLLTNGQTLTGPNGKPLVEFTNETTTFDSVLVSSGPTSSTSLSGPLLKATNSDLTVPFSLLGLLDDSTLITTTSEPLISLNGGNYNLSHLKGTAMFDFWGTKTAVDPETGAEVGSGKTVTHAGPLLEASGGATINTEKVLKLDTALLEATAPIISLLGTETAQTGLTTQQSTIDLMKAKVTSTGPVVAMDKSFINVTNGALINLTHGSNMKVIGDLISMFSGSKINVVNGPLISVAGAGSLLDVSGALVNFGGTGGNKIIVNNSISPTATLSGLPVSATFGGSVGIANPIKNPSLGSISVNGSLISATNGGSVKIQGK